MTNIIPKVTENNVLVLAINLNKEFGLSSSQKSTIIAKTGSMTGETVHTLPDGTEYRFNLNVFKIKKNAKVSVPVADAAVEAVLKNF